MRKLSDVLAEGLNLSNNRGDPNGIEPLARTYVESFNTANDDELPAVAVAEQMMRLLGHDRAFAGSRTTVGQSLDAPRA